jgi:hypothetical protein
MKTASLLMLPGRRRGMGLGPMMRDPGHLGDTISKRPGSATRRSRRRARKRYSSVRGFATPVRLKRRTRHAGWHTPPARELSHCRVRIAPLRAVRASLKASVSDPGRTLGGSILSASCQ